MKSFYFKLIFFGLFLGSTLLNAQEILPKGLTEYERTLLPNYQFRGNLVTPPPAQEVRTSAQWEEVEYVVIRWTPEFQNIQRQIVAAAVDECKVLIATQNQASVQSYLTSNGIDLTNVEFLNAPSNSIWIRDYAGNTVYANDVGERALVDWIYNRPRPADDLLPTYHATHLGAPLYVTNTAPADLVNTGGNFMSDGLGNAFASELILSENQAGNPYGVSAKSEEQVDQILEDYMGIDSYRKMTVLPYDGIHHIDMHMKLLDEETILVSEYPMGIADGPQITENIEYITTNFQTPFGNNYDIRWIPAPPSPSGQHPHNGGAYRTYTNAVIINKTILVPTYRPEVDEEALEIWRDAMPGYRVIGIDVDNNGENLINLGGAIHCITHIIGVENPLWIVHEKVRDLASNVNIPFEAQIKHSSGIESAKIFWKEEGDTEFQELTLTNSSGDNWTATLTASSDAQTINYYIWAEANSGKTLTRPLPAPDGYWTFNITSMGSEEWLKNAIRGPYPNPAKNKVHFDLKDIKGKVKVKFHTVLGQSLMEKEIENPNGRVTLNLNSSWKGVYLVSFEGEFGKITKKLVVK